MRSSGSERRAMTHLCAVVSVGFRLQLREVIRIPLGFDLGGCGVFQCVRERKVDVGVVLVLFCKPGLRPGFSGIDDMRAVPFLSYRAVSSHVQFVMTSQGNTAGVYTFMSHGATACFWINVDLSHHLYVLFEFN